MARRPAAPRPATRTERERRSRSQAEPPAAGESVAGEEDPGAALDQSPAGATTPAPTLKAPIATGKPPLAPGAPASQPGLPLPHERDESIGSAPATPDPTIEQARRDIESGQVDTDLRNPAGLDAEQRKRLLRGAR
jgi:hypothetical protein